MRLRYELLAGLSIAAMALGGAPAAQAAGFYIKEQSVTGLGRAFAGESAVAEDASTIFFNPAGMTELRRAEVEANAHLLLPRSDVDDRGSTFSFLGASAPIAGGSGGNPYDPTPVPNLYAAYPLMERDLWVGLGVSAPFGLANKYRDGWFARYDSIETELTTIDVAPSVAYRVTDWLSIGGGLDIQYAKAKLSSAVFLTPALDAVSTVEGNDWTLGYNLGVLVKPTATTRVGLHYRSQVNHDLEGDVDTRVAATTTTQSGDAKLKLPDILALGVAQQVTPRLTLLGEVNWYGWSNFDEIRVVTAAGASATAQNYQDSYSLALGAQYTLTEAWTLRGGLQYDQTPTKDGFRTTRTPDGDRTWLSGGLSYAIGDDFVLDVAYSHIIVASEEIDLVRPGRSPAAGIPAGSTRILADTEGAVDIISAGIRYRF